ncbi:MAG: stage II sporulation protein M, partial [Anaerolineaceae bacterium]|nr:stage II sporulation protein M [Anaerolineaceae bacterium]
WQNTFVLIISMLLGGISFSIFGVLLVMITMVVAGFGVALILSYGILAPAAIPGIFLPHGLFEIPAIILATAAVLRSGAVLAKPDTEKTIGEVWLSSIADWAKIMVGVVLPLLFVGAALEAWVTLPLMQSLIR